MTAAAAVQVILNRPHPQIPREAPCDCAVCVQIRTTPFACPACGFDGTPIVDPCTCEATRQSNITFLRGELAAIAAEAEQPDRAYYEQRLAEELQRPAPEPRCSTTTPRCGHGTVTCPVCLAFGPQYRTEDLGADHFAAMVREIRAAVTAAHGRNSGGAPEMSIPLTGVPLGSP